MTTTVLEVELRTWWAKLPILRIVFTWLMRRRVKAALGRTLEFAGGTAKIVAVNDTTITVDRALPDSITLERWRVR